MPLIVFNFTTPTGITDSFVQRIPLRFTPPRGARYTLKQVSASTDAPLATAFQFVRLAIPEIMSDNDRVLFQAFTTTPSGALQEIPSDTYLRYYVTDATPQPIGLNVFPNLSLGRHSLNSPFLTLTFEAMRVPLTLTALTAYTVVIEWDTE